MNYNGNDTNNITAAFTSKKKLKSPFNYDIGDKNNEKPLHMSKLFV